MLLLAQRTKQTEYTRPTTSNTGVLEHSPAASYILPKARDGTKLRGTNHQKSRRLAGQLRQVLPAE